MTREGKDFIEVPNDEDDLFAELNREPMFEELEEMDKLEEQMRSPKPSKSKDVNAYKALTSAVLDEEKMTKLRKKLFGI